ncbi:hypothetical protein IWQ51_000642 [Labrenzia sp. EL_142]|nr:hypothetical protein [Labrenzia sp. EL_142]
MRKNMREAMVWRIEPVIAKARIAYWLKLDNSQVGDIVQAVSQTTAAGNGSPVPADQSI